MAWMLLLLKFFSETISGNTSVLENAITSYIDITLGKMLLLRSQSIIHMFLGDYVGSSYQSKT